MNFPDIFTDYTSLTILALIIFSFVAGFIDAAVGGGGLIQLPALLINLPNETLPTLFGTNKTAALSGTSVAAYQYSKRIKFDYKLLIAISFFSLISSYFGAQAISFIDVDKLKPIILVALILIAIYTLYKKDLGAIQTKSLSLQKQIIFGSLIGIIVGFYDGFFGPGTGSFFVLGFVVILGFEFMKASAYSKIINCMTNISALLVFIGNGNYLLEIAILMSICNIIGNIIGSRVALSRGNAFVRIIFLVIVSIMIIRYGYDVFFKD